MKLRPKKLYLKVIRLSVVFTFESTCLFYRLGHSGRLYNFITIWQTLILYITALQCCTHTCARSPYYVLQLCYLWCPLFKKKEKKILWVNRRLPTAHRTICAYVLELDESLKSVCYLCVLSLFILYILVCSWAINCMYIYSRTAYFRKYTR